MLREIRFGNAKFINESRDRHLLFAQKIENLKPLRISEYSVRERIAFVCRTGEWAFDSHYEQYALLKERLQVIPAGNHVSGLEPIS